MRIDYNWNKLYIYIHLYIYVIETSILCYGLIPQVLTVLLTNAHQVWKRPYENFLILEFYPFYLVKIEYFQKASWLHLK